MLEDAGSDQRDPHRVHRVVVAAMLAVGFKQLHPRFVGGSASTAYNPPATPAPADLTFGDVSRLGFAITNIAERQRERLEHL